MPRISVTREIDAPVADVFSVESGDGHTKLDMVMDARAHKLLPRLMNPLVMGLIRKSVEGDMDLVKAFCEK